MQASAIMLADSLKVAVGKQFYSIKKTDSRIKTILELVKKFNTAGSEDEKQDILKEIESAVAPIKYFIDNSEGLFMISDNGNIFHKDNEEIPVPKALGKTIMTYCENGFPIESLAAFWVKLSKNPDPVSREQFYAWLEKNEITVNDDGDAILYKAVRKYQHTGKVVHFGQPGWTIDSQGVLLDVNGDPVTEVVLRNDVCDVEYVDIHSGTFNNTPGMKVTMPRELCDSAVYRHCSTGLHCSTLSYAQSFGNLGDVVILVKVNPANVVSVPNDNFEKIRVCEYDVLGVYEVIPDYGKEKKESLPGYVSLQMSPEVAETVYGGEVVQNDESEESEKADDDFYYAVGDKVHVVCHSGFDFETLYEIKDQLRDEYGDTWYLVTSDSGVSTFVHYNDIED